MRRTRVTNLIVWGGLGIVALLAVVLLWVSGAFRLTNPRLVVAGTASASPTPSPTATGTPASPGLPETAAASLASPTPAAVIVLPEITAPADGQVYSLTPAPDAVGWVREGDDVRNHLGDYNIYAGVFGDQRHLGAIQFDLSAIPPGAPLFYADLTLVGLADKWLGAEGEWTAQLLETWLDADWPQRSFSDLALPEHVAADLEPVVGVADLAAGRTNTFVFGPQALQALEARTLTGQVSFRIAGPASGVDNLFSWDSGYGTRSQGWKPLLRIAAGPAPETLPATPTPVYVLITSTPTPENVVTMAALAAIATVQATTTGTPTSLPPNWVTPIVIVPTATPANAATAQWYAMEATARASLYGTPTPLPPNVWTVTPTPTGFVVVVTNTPTPANWSTAIAQAQAEATRRATAGPSTPLPPHVITATPGPARAVVTSTPTPKNYATARAIGAQATIAALTTGTYTPVPRSWVTATPFPLLIPVDQITPTATPTATPGPNQIPDSLRGKIAFVSDRFGAPQLFVMDPDGSHVAWLTQSNPYEAAQAREAIAPDGLRRVIVQPDERGVPQIFLQDRRYATLSAITHMTGMAYDPAWAPDGDRIAFVSTEPRNDEIYTVNADGSGLVRLTTNTWEWDKHPSWSPDGMQIVFYSNRVTGRRQIWIMNADGSGQTNISQNGYNDWDPIWIK